jgi:hypothetical protein
VTPREIEEYRALRATIRERGSLRVILFIVGVIAWAAATIATAALAALPIATLLPLLVLAAGFEALYAVHTGVERVGRYLEVFYGDEGTREWERTTMAYGRAFRGGGPDALFSTHFYVATILNFVPVLLAEPVRLEVSVIGSVHLLFMGRIFAAHRASEHQRALDLERFERLKQDNSTTG